MNGGEMRQKNRRRVREVEPGILAFYPAPLARRGFIIPDYDTELRVYHFLRRYNTDIYLVLALVAVPICAGAIWYARADGDRAALDVARVVLIWLWVAAMTVRSYALKRMTRGLAIVWDSRPIWTRFVAMHMETPRDTARLIASILLVVGGLYILGTTQGPGLELLIGPRD